MLYTVRVRGIYATALSVLLHKKGFLLSDASKVLQRRLNILYTSRAPDVTIKSLEDKRDYLLIIGYPWEAGEAVYKVLLEELPYLIVRKGTLGLYTIVDAMSLGDCKAELPGGLEGKFDAEICPEQGKIVRATIVREALEENKQIILKEGIKVVGQHVILSKPGKGASFSEHIRDMEKRADLLTTASNQVDLEEYHVHFRSSAKLAKENVLASEIETLRQEIEKILAESPDKPRIVRRGEFIAILGLPSPTKAYLDNLRKTISPTIDRHHSLKSFDNESSALVDCAEYQLNLGGSITGYGIEYYLVNRSLEKKIILEHHKPGGEILTLGPYIVKSARLSGQVIEVDLEKTLKGRGILDGLGVEKRPGDWAKTRIRSSDWFIIHEYYSSSGSLLGVYANVNTPVEFGPSRIKYFDLYIDVVKRPGKTPEIIDKNELEEAYNKGLISHALYTKALEVADYLVRRLSSSYP